jgi:hypothetical protein
VSPGPAPLADVERWFIRRGVPHLIEDYRATEDVWTRALVVLVPAYLLLGLNALDLGWPAWQNALAAAATVLMLAATWAIANRFRGQPAFSRPRIVGSFELAVFVIGPALPSIAFGQPGDGLQAALEGLAVLAVIYAATSYGLLPMLRWAGEWVVDQIPVVANLLVRALSLVLLIVTFFFVNAEVWQVMGTLGGLPYLFTVGMFVLLGAGFALSRMRSLIGDVEAFTTWDEVGELVRGTPAERLGRPAGGHPDPPPLRRRQRLNVGLVAAFSQAIQVTVVVLGVMMFFVLFGFLAIPETTMAAWTADESVHVLARAHLSGRELVVTEELLRVAAFLAAFTGLHFTVVLSTDQAYREEFRDEAQAEIRQVFAVRAAYLASRGPTTT